MLSTALIIYEPNTFFCRSLFSLAICLIFAASAEQALAETSFISTQSALPDMGRLTISTGSLHPNINMYGGSVTFKDTIHSNKLVVKPEYYQQTGFTLNGSLAYLFTNNVAFGIVPTVSADKNEFLVNAGFGLTANQRLILTLNQLSQKLDFSFISGASDEYVTQNSGAISYQYLLGDSLSNIFKINGYLSDTKSRDLDDKAYFKDTTTPLKLWSDPRRIAGSRVASLQGRLVIESTSDAVLTLGLGGEQLKYKLLTGNSGTTHITGRAEWKQRYSHNVNFKAGFNAMAKQNRYNISLARSYKEGYKIGLNFASIDGRGNTPNDKQVQLSYRFNFGARHSSSSNSGGGSNLAYGKHKSTGLNPMGDLLDNRRRVSWPRSLQDQMAARPSFIAANVVAK